MPDTLTVTDNRSGESIEVAIEEGAFRAAELRALGLMSYDPAFLNTASVRSSITFIDGDAGILRYRGYPIEQLAVDSTYLETAFLLLFGELPTLDELRAFEHSVTYHTFLHENMKTLMEGFRYDAHPMGMFVSVVAALGTLYPEAAKVDDPDVRLQQTIRLIAKVPTIAAWSYRHSRGLPYVYPDNDLSFAENFLSMMFKMGEVRYEAEPALVKALEVLFILHADHEQNCSANAMRAIGSSKVDPY
ncbi:MAG TPA: citrate/2-methylcitrate synthase, partial [Gaiellaceae bacterium]|nr:citrate/2-methylcitrate synthase [Gaiellaceae bacterium]